MIRVQVIAIFAAFVVINSIQERMFLKKGLEVVGRLPVPERAFKVGRLSLVFAWLLSVVQAAGLDIRLFRVPAMVEVVSLALFYAGFLIAVLAYLHLGAANKMGLPDERTSLRTAGIYRFCRNPIYAGLLLIDLASVLYTANPLTLLLAAAASAVYRRIVLAEEAFLEQRFGAEYLAYKSRTPRCFI